MVGLEPQHARTPPTLCTLGALRLVGAAVTRPKPLLMLAYLAHEGPTDRERLARLFFVGSLDPRDALSTTVRRLGALVEGAPEMDGRLQALVTTDTLEFQRHAVSAEPRLALRRYRGAFVQGARVTCGVELEEWIVSTRERFGSIARDLHLDLARSELNRERTESAWHHAKAALGLTEGLALEPEPTAQVLQTFLEAGLRVPEGWWRAVTSLGLDRPPHRLPTMTADASQTLQHTHDDRSKRRTPRAGVRVPRAMGQRKPRRLIERP